MLLSSDLTYVPHILNFAENFGREDRETDGKLQLPVLNYMN